MRAGDNLYTSSIVALEAKTGKYRWHFQQVHHDLWDYDAPNPVVLFDAPIAGKTRKGIAEVGKTGWVYILDRTNGKPLIGIDEQRRAAGAAPGDRRDATLPASATRSCRTRSTSRRGLPARERRPDLHAVLGQARAREAAATGGANWPPSSYDPETHLLYVCAHDGISAYSSDGETSFMEPTPGNRYARGMFGRAGIKVRGIFAAVDLTRTSSRGGSNGARCATAARS